MLLALFLALCTSQQKNDIPLMSWGEALRDQLHAKWWLLVLADLEIVRQIHNLIAEHSNGWHRFWQKKVFGGWERRMSRMNPYTRFRFFAPREAARRSSRCSARSSRGCGA